jgi:hypothetical protein
MWNQTKKMHGIFSKQFSEKFSGKVSCVFIEQESVNTYFREGKVVLAGRMSLPRRQFGSPGLKDFITTNSDNFEMSYIQPF